MYYVETNSQSSYYEKFLATEEVKCIDDEIPFDLPNGWVWCRLRSAILGTGAGKSPNCDKRPKLGDEWGVLTTTAIQDCEFKPNENKVLPQKFAINEEQEVGFEDLLITRAGPRNRTGIVCVVDKPFCKLILSDKTVRINYIRGFCNPYFLMYVLSSPAIHDSIMAATVGMADSQVNISQNSIQNIAVPIPPQKEQIKICLLLNKVLPIVNKYSEQQFHLESLNTQILELLKKSILQEAIQGRLVAQCETDEPASVLIEKIRAEKERLVKEGKLKKSALEDSVIFKGDDNKYWEKRGKDLVCIDDEIPFEIPDSWEWVRFGSIINMRMGKTPARGDVNYWTNGKTPWVSISDMFDYGIITNTKEKVSDFAIQTAFGGNIVPKGTLIMSFKLTVGRTSLLDIDAVHNEAIISIIPYFDKKDSLRDYLFYVLPLISNFGDSKDAIKGKTLNSTSLFNLLIPLPPIAEQRRIVNAIVTAWQVL